MKSFAAFIFAAGLAVAAAAPARALDFDQTLRLVQNGVSEPTLLALMEVDPPNYAPTDAQIRQLRAAGAGEAMLGVLGRAFAPERYATAIPAVTAFPAPASASAPPAPAPISTPSPAVVAISAPPASTRMEEAAAGFVEVVNRSSQNFGLFPDARTRRIHLADPANAPYALPPGGVVRLPADPGIWTLGLYGGDYSAEILVRDAGGASVGVDPNGNGLRASVNDGQRIRYFTLAADSAPAAAYPSTLASAPIAVEPAPTPIIIQTSPGAAYVLPSQPYVYTPYTYTAPYTYTPYVYSPYAYRYPSRTWSLGFSWNSGPRYYSAPRHYSAPRSGPPPRRRR